jgi:hypothetical protein
MKTYKPGQTTPISAQYAVKGPRGGETGKEIQSTKGHPLPPTPKPGMKYVAVDPVKNKSGKP